MTCYGFDNVKTGTFTWSLMRGPDWEQYPDHRWDVEKEMARLVAARHDVELTLK